MNPIRISYEIFGAMKSRFKDNTGITEIPESMTLKDFLIKAAGLDQDHLKFMDVTVNGKKVALDSFLKDGMKVKILMPIGGG